MVLVSCRHRRFLATLGAADMVMLGGADFGITTFGFHTKVLGQVLKSVHLMVQIMHVTGYLACILLDL